MHEKKIKLMLGSLLHDMGKVIYRAGDQRRHSATGFEFIREECNIKDKEVLDSIRYHHAEELKSARLAPDSLAYITYFADNVAAFADRRKDEDTLDYGFNKDVPLHSVFNVLNGNNAKGKYRTVYLNHQKGINYPTEEDFPLHTGYYNETKAALQDHLRNIDLTKEYIQSLLEILEGYLSYIPSSTNLSEYPDISLYDHLKITSAVASCVYDYLNEKEESNYSNLSRNSKDYYNKDIFYLYKLDMSGIQNFIYSIVNSKALKSLRTRSFYLEILLEDLIDNIFDELELTRANLLYSGGGHGYLLLPNTNKAIETADRLLKATNNWLIDLFGTELYIAGGGKVCSANNFRDEPKGSYSEIFKEASRVVSKVKLHRYDVPQLKKLNFAEENPSSRECKVCHRTDTLVKDGTDEICEICADIQNFSTRILSSDFFTVEKDSSRDFSLPLPFDRRLVGHSKETLTALLKEDSDYIRSYTKNDSYSGYKLSTKLWVGDYAYDRELKNLIVDTDGIHRLSVLRADVDNLGMTFVKGLDEKVISLTRSATLSRNMSLFFKYHINYILEHGDYKLLDSQEDRRKALIVYSGGDDVFLVGYWADIICAAIDLNKSLKRFSLGSLSLSAGLGLYSQTYPIRLMSLEAGKLEGHAKDHTYEKGGRPGEKDSICLFEKDLTFSWDVFEKKVVEEKLAILLDYMKHVDERGTAFLYNLLDLLRNLEDKINLARLAYTLARLQPRDKEGKEMHDEFSKKIYRFSLSDQDRKELIAAIYIYTYLERRQHAN